MARWIGETFTSDVGWTHLEALVDVGNRMAGSEGERAGAELTREALSAAGARNARLEPFEIQGWSREESAIETADERLACIALPRSPAETLEGELVDVGYGLPEEFEAADLEGAVAVVRSDVPSHYDRYLHRREKYYHAVEAGAAAFVYRNHVEGQLPATGSVGTAEAPIGEIPAVGVSKEVGARLVRRSAGEPVAVSVDAAVGDAESANVHAELGPETDERLLVTSHVDAHDVAEGALDNGAGTATVVEVANALARREDELDCRVEFVAYGAEEVGLVGSSHHADGADPDLIRAVVNNDGVVRGRTLEFYTHGFPELAGAAEAVADRFGHPVETIPKLGPHSDHWPFVVDGVPGYHVMSVTDGAGRGFGHTAADTLDKLDRRNLRESAILLTELVVELAGEDVEIDHREPAEIAAELEAQGLATGMKVTGDWPY